MSINDIASSLPGDVSISMCVDELELWFAASRMSVAERRIQLVFDRVSHWADSHGFRFYHTKTIVIALLPPLGSPARSGPINVRSSDTVH